MVVKLVALLVSVLWICMGVYVLYGHEQWLADQEASYTEQAGRIADDPHFKYKTDEELIGKRNHSVTFQLEGDSSTYSLIIPSDSPLLRQRVLYKGDEVQVGYVDPGLTPPKRRVWYLAKKDQAPLLTRDMARAHADNKNQSVGYLTTLLGFASLLGTIYWILFGR